MNKQSTVIGKHLNDSSHVSFYENSFRLEAGFAYVVSNIILYFVDFLPLTTCIKKASSVDES